MTKIIIVSSLLFSIIIADELVEPVQNQASAVSKVMERFSKLSTIESTPIEDVVEEKVLDTTTAVNVENIEKLELAETIKTAKFESKDVPYPEDKRVIDETVKKVKNVQPEETKKTAVVKEKSLREIEANARKVIEEEMKKVEKAKASALERINRAMEQVEKAKSS
jgi:Fe-S cluster biosynthesis and repair protein YggX